MSMFFKKKILASVVLAALSLGAMAPALAVGTVSRACRFDTIPTGFKNVSVAFFYAIGAPESVLNLPSKPSSEQDDYWILESLTTDYLEMRYLLFSKRALYKLVAEDPVYLERTYDLDGILASTWDVYQVSKALKADKRYAPYYLNREALFSSRAGHPSIVEYRPGRSTRGYMVFGAHWYRDIKSGTERRLEDSFAEDCNLTNWGVGLWNR